MLKFIGSGSAFNTKLGNSGIYWLPEKHKTMVMIDCGETTFSRLQETIIDDEECILDNLEECHVFLTHLHPDHVGSLGTLAFYMFYMKNVKLNVYFPIPEKVQQLSELMGFDHCISINPKEFISAYSDEFNEYTGNLYEGPGLHCAIKVGKQKLNIRTVSTQHDEKMDCYGYILSFKLHEETFKGSPKDLITVDAFDVKRYKFKLFYSGDSNIIPKYINSQIKNNFDAVILDVSTNDYPGNVHLSLSKLLTCIGETNSHKINERIICSHSDKDWDWYNVVERFGMQTASTLQEVNADILEFFPKNEWEKDDDINE